MSIALRYAPVERMPHLMPSMRTVEEIRVARLLQLRVEFGTLSKLNELLQLDRRDSTLSQYINAAPNSRTGKAKMMGSPLARRLEAACSKEVGWMDNDPLLADGAPSAAALRIAKQYDALDERHQRTWDAMWLAYITQMDDAAPPPNPSGPVGAIAPDAAAEARALREFGKTKAPGPASTDHKKRG
jgi:hypothetical protein